MKKVSNILARKGSQIISVSPHATVLDALQLMAERNIGAVMVMHENEFLGIMTERDYSRKVILNGKSSTDTMVSDIMTVDYPAVTPNDSIDYCMTLMTENNIRYLPVFENHQVSSIISISDVVKETIQGQAETISQLKDYLHANL
jgi:CBS domain-containing protein